METTATGATASTWQRMWKTRPVRIPAEQGGNAKIVGVSEGIGVRFQVDPTIVRILFVVTGFLGGGIAVYLLAWMLMPRYSVPVSPAEAILKPGYPAERTHGWWLLLFFLIFSGVIGNMNAELITSPTLIVVALAGMGWWALYRRQPTPPPGLLTIDDSYEHQDNEMNQNNNGAFSSDNNDHLLHPEDYPQAQPDLSRISPVEGYAAPFQQTQSYGEPPSWDPLAQPGYSFNVAATSSAPTPERRKAKKWPWVLLSLGASAALLVVIGGALLASFVEPEQVNSQNGGIGSVDIIATNETLMDEYSIGIGEQTIDLSQLTPLDEIRTVNISSGIGKSMVTLPENVPVQLYCEQGIGESNCSPGEYNPDAEGETLELIIEAGVGEIEVITP